MRNSYGFLALATLAAALWFTGCQPDAANISGSPPEVGHEEHDHAHDHAHGGLHGGHIIELGNEEYHAEWTHDDTGKVTVYILDAEMKNEVPIAAEEITIETKIGEKAGSYKLSAIDSKDVKASKFEIVDKGLLGVLESLSEGVTAKLVIPDINGKAYEAAIEHHSHDHGHAH